MHGLIFAYAQPYPFGEICMKQLIHGGRLLTAGQLDGGPADLLIDGDTIVAVLQPGESVGDDVRRIDARDRLLIPGLVNAHTHAANQLNKGMVDRYSLELLLSAAPWTGGGRTVDYKYLSAYVGALEMVRKGCTACYDLAAEIPAPTVDGIEAVARAYNDVGMRAVIAPMMADVTFYNAIPGLMDAIPPGLRERAAAIRLQSHDQILATCRTILDGWSFDRDRLRPALGPTIPHHCTDDFLTGCRDLAKDHDIGVQMHVLESKVQAVAGVRRYGTTLLFRIIGTEMLSIIDMRNRTIHMRRTLRSSSRREATAQGATYARSGGMRATALAIVSYGLPIPA